MLHHVISPDDDTMSETNVSIAHLMAAGFRPAGRWETPDGASLARGFDVDRKPGVYVYAVNGVIAYVGSAQRGLHRRLRHYEISKKMKTAMRIRSEILASLARGMPWTSIFCLRHRQCSGTGFRSTPSPVSRTALSGKSTRHGTSGAADDGCRLHRRLWQQVPDLHQGDFEAKELFAKIIGDKDFYGFVSDLTQETMSSRGFGNHEDIIIGDNAGDDRMFGNGGDDFFSGSPGKDFMDGGKGWDTLSYEWDDIDAKKGIVLDVTKGTVKDGRGEKDFGQVLFMNNLTSHYRAASISACTKSLPMNSKGSPARFARAYERQSVKFRDAGWRPLP